MQLGSDIDGDAANDSSGWQVSLNDDGTIVTAVAPHMITAPVMPKSISGTEQIGCSWVMT